MDFGKIFDFNVDFIKADGAEIKGEGNKIRLQAGTAGTWELKLGLLANLEKNAKVTIFRYNFQIAHQFQNTNSKRRDYVTISSSGKAKLKMTLLGRAHGIVFEVAEGELVKGDEVVIKIGDRSGGAVGSEVFWTATVGRFVVSADIGGKTVKAAEDVFVDIGCKMEVKCLRFLGPTVAGQDEIFAMNLVVFDINRNVVDSFAGAVVFDVPAGVEGLPREYTFRPADEGIKIFENVKIAREGIFRVGVSLKDGGLKALSNPMICKVNPKQRVFWGDLHAHGWGDCTMFMMHDRNWKVDPAERHRQARMVGRFDYSAPGAMSMPDTPERKEIWQAYLEAFDANNKPGEYVPFMAMEIHPGDAGDRTLIFRDRESLPKSSSMNATVEEVYEKFGGRDDAILETHIGGAVPYYDIYKPENEKMVEVTSGFGNAEWLLQRLLVIGYRPAITGASDLHLGLFGAPRAVETFRGRFIKHLKVRDSGFGNGPVGAVIAEKCERNAIWKSLAERNGYATTGERIYVDLDAGGFRMGQIADLKERFDIKLTVAGEKAIERIDLIVGEYLAESVFPGKMDFCWELKFDRRTMPPGKWFYFRIKQADLEYAWTGPVWFGDGKLRGEDAGELKPWNYCEKPAICHLPQMDVYLKQLEDYLVTEGDREVFGAIEPVGIVKESMGASAKFVSIIRPEQYPVTIRWFYEFEIPKIRVDWGYENFGVVDCQKGPGAAK